MTRSGKDRWQAMNTVKRTLAIVVLATALLGSGATAQADTEVGTTSNSSLDELIEGLYLDVWSR